MLLLDLANNPLYAVTLLVTLVVSLTVHECAHAWSALRLGDPLAYSMGRLTLNPMRHLDKFGSLFFLMVGFGWAKPVPIDPYVLGRRGTLWVALAGPVSNILLATVALLPIRLGLGDAGGGFVGPMLYFFASLNLGLAVFNLLPIAPLDGWNIMMGIVSERMAWSLQRYQQYGPMLLLLLLVSGSVLGFSLIGTVIGTVRDALLQLIAGTS